MRRPRRRARATPELRSLVRVGGRSDDPSLDGFECAPKAMTL